MAVAAATRSGYRIDESLVAEQKRIIAAYLESWRERTLQNIPIAGGVDTIGYLMLGTRAAGQPPDVATDAQAIWLKRRQMPDGRWPVQTIRPPIESNDIEVTAVSMRALQMYAPKPYRREYLDAVDRARNWLATAKAEATKSGRFACSDCRGRRLGGRSSMARYANSWPRNGATADGRSSRR